MWPKSTTPTDGKPSASPHASEKSITIDSNNQSDGPSPSQAPKQNEQCDKTEQPSCPDLTAPSEELAPTRRRSVSRASSLVDDPKSLIDSISASSGRHNWSIKETADHDPSISSIKGDSISATIADYNRKHHNTQQTLDNQSQTSGARLGDGGEATLKTAHDDQTSNINFYADGESTSSNVNNQLGGNIKPGSDFASVSSNANTDAFDIIEESGNVSSCENLAQLDDTKQRGHHRHRHHNKRKRTHHKSRHHQRQAPTSDQAPEIDDLPQEASLYQMEPIILRGNGNLTLFGLSNSFSAEFPSALLGRVSKEEFNRTMSRVNSLLRDHQSLSAKLILLGGLCCCCSLGLSLVWPSIALKRRSKLSLEKFLASENSRLYSKLGLNWKLAEQRCYSNHAFVEYVLMIEFTPKINLYLPD